MAEDTVAFDLELLRQEVKITACYPDLAQAIRDFMSWKASERDVHLAKRALVTLAEIDRMLPEPEKGILGGALFTQAVIAYCRGVFSSKEASDWIDIRPAYSPEQIATHNAIGALRNSVVAHHGNGRGEFGTNWRRHRAIMHEKDGNPFSITDADSTPNYIGFVATELAGLVTTAEPFIVSNRTISALALLEKVQTLKDTDDHFEGLLLRFRFDPATFFRREDAAEMFKAAKGRTFTTFD